MHRNCSMSRMYGHKCLTVFPLHTSPVLKWQAFLHRAHHFSLLQSPACLLPSISHCVNTVCWPACNMSCLQYTLSVAQESGLLVAEYLAPSTVLLHRWSSRLDKWEREGGGQWKSCGLWAPKFQLSTLCSQTFILLTPSTLILSLSILSIY